MVVSVSIYYAEKLVQRGKVRYVSRPASFQKFRKNIHNAFEQMRQILSDRECDEEL